MKALAILGLVLFAVAWFVPVHEALGTPDDLLRTADDIGRALGGEEGARSYPGPPGWRACRAAWEMLTAAKGKDETTSVLLGLTSLTNVVMALAGLAVFGGMRGSGARMLGVLLLACAALNAGWLYHTDGAFRSGLQAGYWLWLASFGFVGLAMAAPSRE